MTLQIVRSSVATTLNSTVASGADGRGQLPNGVTLRSVQPYFPNGETVPRGRVYASVEIVDQGTGEVLQTPWRGYVYSPNVRASRPNFAVPDGCFARVRATQTNRGSTVVVAARLLVDMDPVARGAGGGDVMEESPGEGIGEFIEIDLGNPAAGANYTNQVSPAREAWRLLSFVGTLVTSAAVGNRQVAVEAFVGGAALITGVATNVQTASLTKNYRGRSGPNTRGDAVGSYQGFVLPDDKFPGGTTFQFIVNDIDAADNLGQGTIAVETWAVPA